MTSVALMMFAMCLIPPWVVAGALRW
jgi:hypothetical protein